MAQVLNLISWIKGVCDYRCIPKLLGVIFTVNSYIAQSPFDPYALVCSCEG